MLGTTTAELGESPVWLADDAAVVCVDMISGAIHRYRFDDTSSTIETVSTYLGAVVATRSGQLAGVTIDGVSMLSGNTLTPAVRILDDDSLRLNDAATDVWGRLWVGSTSRQDEPGAGALHVWSHGEKPAVVHGGMTQPNGIGWTADNSHAYVVDTGRSVVLRADVNPATGDIGAFDDFIVIEGGKPDGLAVAADGSIWLAIWDGSRLERYSADGTLIETIPTPVARPTSAAFTPGGRLVVTTARFGLDADALAAQPLAGRLLALDVGVDGVPMGALAL